MNYLSSPSKNPPPAKVGVLATFQDSKKAFPDLLLPEAAYNRVTFTQIRSKLQDIAWNLFHAKA